MSQKPTKSTFSTILQDALADATPEQRDKINEVLSFADAAFCKKVDDRYNARMYSDESISYNRVPTFNDPKGAALDMLDKSEMGVFVAMSRGLIRGYYISSSVSELAEIASMSRPTVSAAIAGLVKNGFIAVHTPASGKRTQTLWMLNPLCIGNGKILYKSVAVVEFEKLAGATAMAAFYSHRRKWQAVGQTIDIGEEKLSYSTIIPYAEAQETSAQGKEKEPSDAPTPNSSYKPTKDKTIVSSNRKTVKKPPKQRDWSTYPDNLPGQMSMSDYSIPTDVNDPALPFNQ